MDSFTLEINIPGQKSIPALKFLLGSTGFVLSLQVDGRRHLSSPLYLSGSTCSIPNAVTLQPSTMPSLICKLLLNMLHPFSCRFIEVLLCIGQILY